jgi:centrosomal protein CEP44
MDGIPLGYLPIIHHSLLIYSPLVAKHIGELGFELQAKSDYRFIENTYKIL